MNKILLLLFIVFSTLTFGKKTNELNFNVADFNKKMEIAEWLCTYDLVAWWTSDSVMTQDKKEIERLGSEWFCFQINDTWHAVYGKYENMKISTLTLFFIFKLTKMRKSQEFMKVLIQLY